MGGRVGPVTRRIRRKDGDGIAGGRRCRSAALTQPEPSNIERAGASGAGGAVQRCRRNLSFRSRLILALQAELAPPSGADEQRATLSLIGFVAISIAMPAALPEADREEDHARDGDDADDEEERIGHALIMMEDPTIVQGCDI